MKQIDGNLALDEEFLDEIEEVDENTAESVVTYYNEYTKNKARKRRKSTEKAKRKLKRLSKISGFPSPVFPCNKTGKYEDEEDKVTHYKKITLAGNKGGVGKFIQRLTNRRVRHMDIEDTLTRNEYRRKYDKWWELF